MSGVSPEPGVYVARYGWNGRSGGLIIGAAVFVLIALTVPMSLALRVVTLVLFGGGALVFIASIATRRVALRVDARGITLGGSPGRYRSTTRLIPWADVREVVLWRQPMPYGRSVRYVAVARHRGAPPLAGRRGRGRPGDSPRAYAGQRRRAAGQPRSEPVAPGYGPDDRRRGALRARRPRRRQGRRPAHRAAGWPHVVKARTSPPAVSSIGRRGRAGTAALVRPRRGRPARDRHRGGVRCGSQARGGPGQRSQP